LLRWLLVGAGAALAIRWRPFRAAVEGDSMVPTLRGGDFVVAVRTRRPRRGAVVVVEHPDRPGLEIVKRVAAVPGDVVRGRTLGPNEYWVLGDHPSRSTDSRTFGAVSSGHIKGVVAFRYWASARWSASEADGSALAGR
jgi:nickel-type superoxide dismutase maturation protease